MLHQKKTKTISFSKEKEKRDELRRPSIDNGISSFRPGILKWSVPIKQMVVFLVIALFGALLIGGILGYVMLSFVTAEGSGGDTQATTVSATTTPAVSANDASQTWYILQSGAFQTDEMLTSHEALLHQQGFPVMLFKTNLTYVWVGASTDQELLAAWSQVAADKGIPVYVKKIDVAIDSSLEKSVQLLDQLSQVSLAKMLGNDISDEALGDVSAIVQAEGSSFDWSEEAMVLSLLKDNPLELQVNIMQELGTYVSRE
ncbi:hypothetical protein FLK61_34865 [Paenalkalicoccus suaedae]|uniref:SPOR domain-containing protein n=1 Tax=Paenalkalicoccus suaedae TaxID=2592382 RepID=A0A859FGQ7_9BACI|nr:hypothetical protein [Paenalkalicoccus suaedae]QKS71852.1 hypothetical protein FLK61_34865 [Paenalkalicoccus suaedae]